MSRWEQFAEREPRLSEAGRALFYQYGPGLGFLATVRADGGPRMHPICPVIAEGRYSTPDDVAAAFDAGAFAVVVGTAITDPTALTRRLAAGAGRSRSHGAPR